MEKMKNRYRNLLKAYKSFQLILKRYSHPPKYADEQDIEAYMTTLIKRFELTYEQLWKILKVYLDDVLGVDAMGSKDVFRKCLELKIITEKQATELLNIIEDRNLVVHEYNQDKANELSGKINKHYGPILTEVITKLDELVR